VSSWEGDLVWLYPGRGVDGFGDPISYRALASQSPYQWEGVSSLALADLDLNGARELLAGHGAAGESYHYLTILPDFSTGTPGAPVDIASGNGVRAVATADWNGDGRPDIAATSGANEDVWVYLSRP
jgi:hypothetical protein